MAIVDSQSGQLPPQPFMSRAPSAEPMPDEHAYSDEESSESEPDHSIVPEDDYSSAVERLKNWIGDHNIARHFDIQTLDVLGQAVINGFNIDEQSRAQWKEEAENALNFATQKAQPKQYPWPDASNIIFPIITQAAFTFSAITYPAIIDNRNVVKGQVWGSDEGTPATVDGKPGSAPKMDAQGNTIWLIPPGEKEKRATRIGQHMSYQILCEMPEWEEQTDTMLMQLPIIGGAVRKTYRDTSTGENKSLLVSLLNIVWNKSAASFERAPRHTEILTKYPSEIEELERDDETFLTVTYGPGDAGDDGRDPGDPDSPHYFLEQHCRYDLDGDGYPEPLVVTVVKRSGKVVRIVSRFDPDGIKTNEDGEIQRIVPVDYYTLYRFLPDPRGGSYPVGFGHLLKPMNEAINTSINQMFDAGHLQIAGGGFIGTSLSIHSGPVNFQLGEYKPVNNRGQSIRDAVFPIPFPGPSAVLFQLLGFLVNAAKDVASIQNILSGDASLANVQPTTLLALIEQGMRLYTAIYKRIYRALKSELDKLYRLNRLYITRDERYQVGDDWLTVTADDYRLGGGVKPVADPNMVTDMQKISRALVVAQFKDDPFCDPVETRRILFSAARIDNIDKVLKSQPPAPPPDKVLEMQEAQANLGRIRAAEVKDMTQGYLNMAQAQKAVGDAEAAKLGPIIEAMRLHIESVNSTVKAAHVDAEFHGHNMRMKQAGEEARSAGRAAKTVAGAAAAGQSAPQGAGQPVLPAMAPPPGNGSVPALPQGPGGQLPPGSPPGMGSGASGPGG